MYRITCNECAERYTEEEEPRVCLICGSDEIVSVFVGDPDDEDDDDYEDD